MNARVPSLLAVLALAALPLAGLPAQAQVLSNTLTAVNGCQNSPTTECPTVVPAAQRDAACPTTDLCPAGTLEALADGGFEGDGSGYTLHYNAELATGAGIGGGKAIAMTQEGLVRDENSGAHGKLGLHLRQGTPRNLASIDRFTVQYDPTTLDMPQNPWALVSLQIYYSLDANGDGVRDLCLVSDIQPITQAPGYKQMAFGRDSLFTLRDGDCTVASTPHTFSFYQANPALQTARIIGLVMQLVASEIPTWPDSTFYVDDASLRMVPSCLTPVADVPTLQVCSAVDKASSRDLVAKIVPFNAFRSNALTSMEPVLSRYLFTVEVFHGDGTPYTFTDWRIEVASVDASRLPALADNVDPLLFLSMGSYGSVDYAASGNDGDNEVLVDLPAWLVVGAGLNNQLTVLTFTVPGELVDSIGTYSEMANTLLALGQPGAADLVDQGTPTLVLFRSNGGNPLHQGDFTTNAVLGNPLGFASHLLPYLLGYLPPS